MSQRKGARAIAAGRQSRCELQRCQQAAGVGTAGTRQIEGRAMIDRGADDRQAECDVDG